jgi:phosphoribosylglycinamide formyltransferase
VTYVLSSRSNAYGLTRAANARPPVPTSVCALKTFLNRNPGATREDYDAEVARRVLESRPDIVVLAGWMHILSDSFLDILEGHKAQPAAPALPPPSGEAAPKHVAAADVIPEKELPAPPPTQHFPIPCINLHPALPGAFDGANAIPRAFEAWQKGEVKGTGVMVHRVIREVDRGEPLIVREVEIKEGDELADVEARIHSVEHEIIVEGTKKVLEELEAEAQLEGARQAVEKVAIKDDADEKKEEA